MLIADLFKPTRKISEEQLLIRRRRNHARRVYKKNKLFALEEIRVRYPDYTEDLLLQDLKLRSKPKKWKTFQTRGKKAAKDFRSCQLYKLAAILKSTDKNSPEYDKLCTRIAILKHAHSRKERIELLVKLSGNKKVYSFKWSTPEYWIKTFIETANKPGATIEALDELQERIINNSII